MRYTNIQVLRFATAVAVVAAHTSPLTADCLELREPLFSGTTFELLGTAAYLFFAMSGFVLTHCLRTTPVKQFLLWRSIRIYFGYWLAVGLSLVWVRIMIGPVPFVRGLATSLLLWPSGPGGNAYILGGLEWTLVYEVFYGFALAAFALAGPRRGVNVGATVWLALCVAKATLSANGSVPLHPTWGNIWLSAANVPFLLGVLSYELRGRGLEFVRLAAPVAAPAILAAGRIIPREDWGLMVQGAACALAVSWCAAARQLPAQHPLVRYGDWTYGVYLIHYVVLMAVLGNGPRQGWLPMTMSAAVATGFFALAFSLAFGYAEATAYGWLRAHLVRRRVPDVLPFARAAARAA